MHASPTKKAPRLFRRTAFWLVVCAGLAGGLFFLRRVVQNDPRQDAALRLNAQVAATREDWSEVRTTIAKLSSASVADKRLHALALSNLRMFGEAALAWQNLRMSDPQADNSLRQLFLAWQQARRGNDIFDLSQAIMRRSQRGYPVAHAMLALLAQKTGRHDEAAEHFGELHRQLPMIEHWRVEFARSLLHIGRPEQVAELLTGIESAEAHWLLSRAALQRGQVDEASKHFDRAGKLDPALGEAFGTRSEPAPLVGSRACADCHAEQFAAQSESRHAATFRPIRSSGLGDRVPSGWTPDPLDPRFEHRFDGQRVIVRRRGSDEHAVLQLIYLMGSGTRGHTPVAQNASGAIREYRLSFYPAVGWDLTTGQVEGHSLADHTGKLLHPLEADGCLRCHNTNTAAARSSADGRASTELGVHCESCHGPGKHHVLSAQSGFVDTAIRNPARLSAAEAVEVCAACHQPDAPVDVLNATHARFQTATFRASRCFQESGSLSCTTCHDPHRDASRNAAHYDSRCAQCHSRSGLPCPITPTESSCVACHMPRVVGGMRHTTFADHFIRVPSTDAARPAKK